MESLPLSLRLKRESQKKIAYAQDLIVKEVMKADSNAVMHGGTAIWRCYGGKRFSEDVDYYMDRNLQTINALFQAFEEAGFAIIKKKIGERSIFSDLAFDRVTVRFEATFQKKKSVLADYELSDGNFITLFSLSPESFIQEKVEAYLHRKKVRDLWDVFFLIKKADVITIKKDISHLLKSYTPPVDETDLKAIILEGITPSSKDILEYMRTWERKNTKNG